MADTFDIIIIGSGNAGFGVSAVAHAAGKKIAFIEERDFGGTCPNRRCTPQKVLVAAVHALHEIEIASAHRITVGKPKLEGCPDRPWASNDRLDAGCDAWGGVESRNRIQGPGEVFGRQFNRYRWHCHRRRQHRHRYRFNPTGAVSPRCRAHDHIG